MNRHQKVLCPVDLSANSMAAVGLATMIAKQNNSGLVFLYVAPQWLPEEAMFGSDYVRDTVEEDKSQFLKIRPTDAAVEFEHIFVNGNPGPEIVRASKSCDTVVMSTHGKAGIMRFLMGSVAQYVMRHSACSLVMVKNLKIEQPAADDDRQKQTFVTDIMRHVRPIRGFDKIEKVITELERANESGAPVSDTSGCCIGILTKTDIAKYLSLQERYKNRDETVIDEMFETDEFGQRRASNFDFDQVHRHMTSPVVTISNNESCQKARELFENNKNIHHLVVVDDGNHPIGIVETQDVNECKDLPSGA